MSEWKEYKFSNFATINPTVKLPTNELISFVEMKDLDSSKRFCYPSTERINGSGAKFEEGDTLFARITPCLENGKICQVKGLKNKKGLGSTEFLVFRGKEHISDINFVYYLSRWDEVRAHAEINLDGTSGRQRVPKECFNDLLLNLPINIEEQRAIASVLSSLDDKIDLLHRQNTTLEKMAEALFKQWFVKDVQESLEMGVISDILEFNPVRKLSQNIVAPFLEMANLSTLTYAPSYWYERSFSSGSKFINGDTLLARITPCLENGKTAYVDFLQNEQIGWGSTEFIVMRPKVALHPFFGYVIAKYQDFRDYAESCMSGSSGRQRVDIENLKGYEIKIPDSDTIEKFNAFAESTVGKMRNNNEQIRTLTKFRDTLLPKLMSGEVRVKMEGDEA